MDAASADLGGLIRQLRLGTGMTQRDLAGRAGLSVRALRDIERGQARPRSRSIDRLATALRLDDTGRDRLRDAHAGARDSAHTGATIEAPFLPAPPAPDTTGVRVGILGPLEVRRDGVPVP